MGKKGDEVYPETDNILRRLISSGSYFNLILLLIGSFLIFMMGLGAFTLILSFVLVPFFFMVSPFNKSIDLEVGPLNIGGPAESILFVGIGLVFLATFLFFIDIIIGYLRKNLSIKIGDWEFGKKTEQEDQIKNKKKSSRKDNRSKE